MRTHLSKWEVTLLIIEQSLVSPSRVSLSFSLIADPFFSFLLFSDSLTIERLLTQAGLRLAATLNTVFKKIAQDYHHSNESAKTVQEEEGPLNLSWMEEDAGILEW
jgi:hypothetical protein